MAQGLDRTEITVQDANAARRRGAVATPERGLVYTPFNANLSQVGGALDGLAAALGGATRYMAKMQDDALKQADFDARQAVVQGETLDDLKARGADMYTLKAYSAFSQAAQITNAGLEAEANINPETDPAELAARTSEQFKELLGDTSDMSPAHRDMLLSTAERAAQRVLVAQTQAHTQYVKERAVQASNEYLSSEVQAAQDPMDALEIIKEFGQTEDPNISVQQRQGIIQQTLLAMAPSDVVYMLSGGTSGRSAADLSWDATIFAESSGLGDYAADGTLLESEDGALGAAQVLPTTAADPGYGVKPMQITPDMTPEQVNAERMRVGKELFFAWEKKFGSTELAHMAYNWGPGNVGTWLASGANPDEIPSETKNYLIKIAKYKQEHQQGGTPDVLSMTSALVDKFGLDVGQARAVAGTVLREHSKVEATFNINVERSRSMMIDSVGRGDLSAVDAITQLESTGWYTPEELKSTHRVLEEKQRAYTEAENQITSDMNNMVSGRIDGISPERQQTAMERLVTQYMEYSGDADKTSAEAHVVSAFAVNGTVPAHAARWFAKAFVNNGMDNEGKLTPGAQRMYSVYATLRANGHIGAADALLDKVPDATKAVLLDVYSRDANTGADMSGALQQAVIEHRAKQDAAATDKRAEAIGITEELVTAALSSAVAERQSYWITQLFRGVTGIGAKTSMQQSIEAQAPTGQMLAMIKNQAALNYDPNSGVSPEAYLRVAARQVLSASYPMLNGQTLLVKPGTDVAGMLGIDPVVLQDNPFALAEALAGFVEKNHPSYKMRADYAGPGLSPLAGQLVAVGPVGVAASVASAVANAIVPEEPAAFVFFDAPNKTLVVYPRKADPTGGEPTTDLDRPPIRVPLSDLGKYWRDQMLSDQDKSIWNSIVKNVHGALGAIEAGADKVDAAIRGYQPGTLSGMIQSNIPQ